MDGAVFDEYSAHLNVPGKILLVDLYSDGLSLPHSGTQSVTPVRVRFPNVSGQQTNWFTVGVEPIHGHDGVATTALKKTVTRRELFQRFIFILFQDMIHASRSGFMIGNTLIHPRLHILNVDQKEERRLLCLRGAGGFRSCSLCDIIFVNRKPQNASATCTVSDVDSVDSSIDHSDMTHTLHRGASTHRCNTHSAPQPCTEHDIRRRHLSTDLATERLVSEVVQQQINIGKLTLRSQDGSSSSSRDLGPLNRAKIMDYLKTHSALEFPPALAGFLGCGSAPFRLYRCVAFDKLHNFDIGILRMLMEGTLRFFKTSTTTTISTTATVNVVNQRLFDLPRCFSIPRVAIIPSTEGQLQPAMTGKLRRIVSAVLPFAILGVCSASHPDSDDLLQLCLLADHVNQLLSGVNVDSNSSRLTLDDINYIQQTCTTLGRQLCTVFNVKVNTKTHRLMHHVHNALTSFGSIKWGCNDKNESMHKDFKQSY